MLSPPWLFICLLEAPKGIKCLFFWLGLVTGASEINWKGSCTLSKKEKRKKKSLNEPKKTQTKCEKSLKFSFNAVTLKKASFI